MKTSHDLSKGPMLDIRHLRLIDAIGQSQSLSAAAEHLSVTQSALSHRLQAAEKRLGFAICSRQGRKLVLTAAGERLKPTARRLLEDLRSAEAEAAAGSADLGHHRVVIGQVHYVGMPWSAAFWKWMRDATPDIRLEFHSGFGQSSVDDLLRGHVDVLISPLEQMYGELLDMGSWRDTLVAIMPSAHPWTELQHVRPEDLCDQTFLTYNFDASPGLENARFMQPAGCYPARSVSLGHTSAVLNHVAAGMGVSILMRWPIQDWLERGDLVARPLAPVGTTKIGLDCSWHVFVRKDATDRSPSAQTARAMVDWFNSADA